MPRPPPVTRAALPERGVGDRAVFEDMEPTILPQPGGGRGYRKRAVGVRTVDAQGAGLPRVGHGLIMPLQQILTIIVARIAKHAVDVV